MNAIASDEAGIRAAVDLDNVVVAIIESARRSAAASAGIDVYDVVDTGIYVAPFTHEDPAIAALLVTDHDFWQREEILIEAPPLPGAIEALQELESLGALAGYVTRRPKTARRITGEWLRRHGAPKAPLEMVGDRVAHRNHQLCKAEICSTIGATHLVDDSETEVERALACGIVPILVDHPLGRVARKAWRTGFPEVTIAADLPAAVAIIARMSAAATVEEVAGAAA